MKEEKQFSFYVQLTEEFRKKDAVKYPPISETNYQELQEIFKSKLNGD